MKQYANFECFGIVSDVYKDLEKNFLRLLINVNACDTYGHPKGSNPYFVHMYESAFHSVHPYVQKGDGIIIKECFPRIDYNKKTIFLEVRYSSHVLLIPSGNRSELLHRANATLNNINPQGNII